jgi:hypothetical protein
MEAFRFNNLVYIPITKHASTSYRHLFRDILSWQEIQTDEIDWTHDYVFAHLLHPYTRHLKGITECVKNYRLNELVDNDNFLKLLGTAVFDLHSYPLSVAFGNDLYKIDWILLDHPIYNSNYLTLCFLNQNGVMIDEIPHMNSSFPDEKQLLEKIQHIRDSNNLTGTLTYFYEQDVILYDRVNRYSKYYELNNNRSWSECSWLTNYEPVKTQVEL